MFAFKCIEGLKGIVVEQISDVSNAFVLPIKEYHVADCFCQDINRYGDFSQFRG